mgnify:CR=1 FL=1
MITLAECKKILNAQKIKYTDEQVKQVRQYLYLLAEMQIEIDNRNRNEKCNNI